MFPRAMENSAGLTLMSDERMVVCFQNCHTFAPNNFTTLNQPIMKNSPVMRVAGALMIASVLFLSSCQDIFESRTELLTEGPWSFQSFQNPDLDATERAFITAIFSLTTWDYMANGTYSISFADTTFSADDGTWEFNDDASVITQDKGTDDEAMLNILELSETTLSYTFDDSTGTNTLTWTR